MAKSLTSFARRQEKEASDESKVETTSTEETQETETSEESETSEETGTSEEETETSEEESETSEETGTSDTSGKSASVLPPGYIGVNASDLTTLQEKARKWDAAESEYNTLKSWYANTIQIGASAKEDISTTTAKTAKNDVFSQPWNAKAIQIAESSK